MSKEERKCSGCNHRIICGLRIRISGVKAFLIGHTTEGLHIWCDSFANICKHYEDSEFKLKGEKT